MNAWSPGQTLESIEKAAILEAYKFYKNNKTQTADSLGIAIRTLDAKLERYDHDKRDVARRYEELRREKEVQLQKQRGLVESLPSPSAGARVESAFEIIAEPEVSLSEREKVQEVLPRQSAQGSHKRGR